MSNARVTMGPRRQISLFREHSDCTNCLRNLDIGCRVGGQVATFADNLVNLNAVLVPPTSDGNSNGDEMCLNCAVTHVEIVEG